MQTIFKLILNIFSYSYAPKNVCKILVGNKCDLQDKRQVRHAQGKEFAESHGMKFIETSAKTSFNVYDSFISISGNMVQELQSQEIKNSPDSYIV